MISKIKKKTYSKRKTEDYILSRKIKFIYSRVLKFLQILALISIVLAIGWVIKFDGYEKISNLVYEKGTSFFISLGLKITSVEIEGNKMVPTDLILSKIVEAFKLDSLSDISKKSIILIDIDTLREAMTSIGWIDSVEIRRKLPGTLVVNILERKPKLIWQEGGKIWLADEHGNLLTQKIEPQYVHLLLVIGNDSKKDIPEFFNIINSEENLSQLVTGAIKVGNRRWDISLNNNIKIKLPEEKPSYAWAKLEELEKQNALFTKKINYVDMRIENELVTGVEKEDTNEISKTKEGIATSVGNIGNLH